MHELKALKEKLFEELITFGNQGELTASKLDVIDKLTHTIKNMCKIMEMGDEGESSRRSRAEASNAMSRYSEDGGSYARRSMLADEDMSSARSYARRRDSRGRYSGAEDMMEELKELKRMATDEATKNQISKLMAMAENM